MVSNPNVTSPGLSEQIENVTVWLARQIQVFADTGLLQFPMFIFTVPVVNPIGIIRMALA